MPTDGLPQTIARTGYPYSLASWKPSRRVGPVPSPVLLAPQSKRCTIAPTSKAGSRDRREVARGGRLSNAPEWMSPPCSGQQIVEASGYRLGGTAGEPDAGILEGGGYTMHGGFWGGVTVVYPVFLPLVLRGS